jgi:hypothetical protein
MMNEKATIDRIEVPGDRILLYPVQKPSRLGGFYYIIASKESAGHIKVGDVVEYEPYGFNFGWFKAGPITA